VLYSCYNYYILYITIYYHCYYLALLTLRESYEGEMTESNIEVGVIGADRIFRVLTTSEVKDYLDEAN